MKRKGAPSLTKEEECYSELRDLLIHDPEDRFYRGQKDVPTLLESLRRAAKECPGSFSVVDSQEKTLLFWACQSKQVTVEILSIFYEVNPNAFDQPMDLGEGKKRLPVAAITFNDKAPYDAFRFLMDKAKPMRDPYDYYLELRFLCKHKLVPVKASVLNRVVEACPGAVHMECLPSDRGWENDKTLLHLLCSNERATLEAVSYLYEIYPEAILTHSERRGCPLHAACASVLSSDVIFFLMEQNPEALKINRYGTPLHHYCGAGVQPRDSMQENFPSNENECALKRSKLDVEVVRRLVQIYPEALHSLPNPLSGRRSGTPLHILAKLLGRNVDNSAVVALILELATLCPAALRVQQDHEHYPVYPFLHEICSIRTDDSIVPLFQLVDFDPTLLTLSSIGRGLLPIHALCKNWYETPIAVLKCLLDLAPDAAMVPTYDGLLPIHLLLLETCNKVTLDAIKVLVDRNRDMLKVSAGTNLGLPIHVAVRRSQGLIDDKRAIVEADITKYLLDVCPESTKARVSSGATALDLAILEHCQNLVDVLLDADPDVAAAVWGETQITSFHVACMHSSLETIKKIHEFHPHLIRHSNAHQKLPLHYAIFGMQEPPIIGFLVQVFPESIVAKDENGFLPLHMAVAAEDPEMWLIKILMKCYPTAIHIPTNDGKYPIQILCNSAHFGYQDQSVVRYLASQLPYSIDRCDGEGRNIFHLFCQHAWHGRDEMAIETLTKLHELSPEAIQKNSQEFGLPIHVACRAGSSVKFLKHLIELYPESIGHNHNALGLPLHCSLRFESLFEFFIEKQYESHTKEHGEFLLHALLQDDEMSRKEALATRLIEVSKYRQDQESCPFSGSGFKRKERRITEMKDNRGRLPLHLAVSNGLSVEFVGDLIDKHFAALNERDDEGKTPLHHAFQNNARPEIIEMLLLQSQAPMTIQDNNKCLPFHLGCQYHREHDFMKRLIGDIGYQYEYIADFDFLPEQIDKDGDLPLHKACIGGNLQCIPSLVSAYPLALGTRNNTGMFPVYLLCQEAGKDRDDFEEREQAYVSGIFELLRRNPESILVENQT